MTVFQQVSFGYLVPPEDGWRRSREAFERALALDPGLAEAHAALGGLQLSHDRDWSGADASFHRALSLEPGNPQWIGPAGTLAGRLGRLEEAIALHRRNIDLDPLNSRAYMNVATAYYFAGRLEAAERAVEMALQLNPRMVNAHGLLGKIYLSQSRPAEALAEMEKETEPPRLWGLAFACHALGSSSTDWPRPSAATRPIRCRTCARTITRSRPRAIRQSSATPW